MRLRLSPLLGVVLVVIAHVAAPGAKPALVPVSGLKELSALSASAGGYGLSPVEYCFLALKKDGRAVVYPVAESADARHRRVMQYPSARVRFGVLVDVAASNAGRFANLGDALQQRQRTSNRHHEGAVPLFVRTTVAVKNAADKVVGGLRWEVWISSGRAKITGQGCRADRYATHLRSPSDRLALAYSIPERNDVIMVLRRQTKNDGSLRTAAVGHHEAKPIGSGFTIDVGKEVFLNFMNTRS